MKRLIVSSRGGIQDRGYLGQLLIRIDEAPVLMFANTNENSPQVSCVVSVRKFLDPRLLMDRWALVADGSSYAAWDYVNREEARLAYLELLVQCARKGVVWDASSDGWRA